MAAPLRLPDAHQFSLTIPGLPELQEMVRSFAAQALHFADFLEPEIVQLSAAVGSAVRLIEAAVEEGGDVDLPLTIAAAVDAVAIEFSILEHGRPLGAGDEDRRGSDIPEQIRPARVFDRVWWVHLGPQGSELHLRHARPHAEISALAGVTPRFEQEAAEVAQAEAPPPGVEYRFRAFQESDALEVARCIYEAYGYTYPNPDLFYPDRIVALNRDGRLRSMVAESSTGALVGHYALERPDLGPIGEAGQAVIHHAHRGHGLMKPMRQFVEDDGRRAGLLGIWSQPTARHPFSQKMNLSFGSVPCGLSLGTTPAATVLRGGDADDGAGVRHSCFLYWHPLAPEEPLRAHAPESLIPLLTALYAARGRAVTFDAAPHCPAPRAGDADAVHAVYDRTRGVGRILVDRVGAESLPVVLEAARVLQDIAGAEALFIDLPIADPGCALLATALAESGFIPAGIGPRFHRLPGGAEDTLRLQKPLSPIDRAGLIAEGPLGRQLADFILSHLP